MMYNVLLKGIEAYELVSSLYANNVLHIYVTNLRAGD